MTASIRLGCTLLPLALLAACADMQMAPPPRELASARLAPPPPVPQPAITFVADQRAEAQRLDAQGMVAEARLHWRYVAVMVPNDAEAAREIARLDALIRTRSDALLQQGEAALMRGRTADAQLAYLKVLALDGSNQRARARLRELDTRAALVSQTQKNIRDQAAAQKAGTEIPID
jgi:hypothetical protein